MDVIGSPIIAISAGTLKLLDLDECRSPRRLGKKFREEIINKLSPLLTLWRGHVLTKFPQKLIFLFGKNLNLLFVYNYKQQQQQQQHRLEKGKKCRMSEVCLLLSSSSVGVAPIRTIPATSTTKATTKAASTTTITTAKHKCSPKSRAFRTMTLNI